VLLGTCCADFIEICTDGLCGDGETASGEECDDGNLVDGDGCSSTCETEALQCGDGSVGSGEACDDGNVVDGDGCSAACQIEVPAFCGNGVVEFGEECDDENLFGADGCDDTCEVDDDWLCYHAPSLCFPESVVTVITSQAQLKTALQSADDGDVFVIDGAAYNESRTVAGTLTHIQGTVQIDADITVIGDGTRPVLSGDLNGAVLRILSGASVTFVNVRVESHGAADEGIVVEGGAQLVLREARVGPTRGYALHALDNSILQVGRVVVVTSAGVLVETADFFLQNMLISKNTRNAGGEGEDNVAVGGLRLTETPLATSRARFLTVVENDAPGNGDAADGVHCDKGARVEDSILAFNDASEGAGCEFEDIVIPSESVDVDGALIIVGDPGFVDVSGGDYRLTPGSPAVDVSQDGPNRDLEGVLRPLGAGYDLGCYESH